jgi:preprotein translocase subunit YajC
VGAVSDPPMFPQLHEFASLLIAQATTEAADQGGLRPDYFLPVVMIAILYMVWIRPVTKERKAQQTMLETLKRGDEIITTSGMIGTIADMAEGFLTIEVAKNVKIRVLKSAIAKRLEEPKAKTEDKASETAPKAPKT